MWAKSGLVGLVQASRQQPANTGRWTIQIRCRKADIDFGRFKCILGFVCGRQLGDYGEESVALAAFPVDASIKEKEPSAHVAVHSLPR